MEELVLQNHCATERRDPLDEPGPTSDPPSYIPEGEADAKWLEGVGARDASVISDWSNEISFRIISLDEALRSDTIGDSATTNAVHGCADVNAWLPPKDEGSTMLEIYANHVAFLHHVVHVPSVRRVMDDLYYQLSLGFNPKPNHAALLLSIFASTAYMMSSNTTGLHSLGQQYAKKCAFVWSKAALNLFEHSSRSTQGSIEDIQAAIFLSFVVFNFEGYTMRFRLLSSRALTMARDIFLHRIDAEANRCHERHIELEIKRRVWYHIVSTD
ncbi:hypothetical protein PHISP_05736 [Aspergillus sp. HF37]|nr:hypothetical protein PHISP_05736 [Aspergillus sp. HF37]